MKKNNINTSDFDNTLKSLAEKYNLDEYYNYRFILKDRKSIMKEFFENYFEKVEGSAFSGDKASYTVNAIFQSLEKNKNIKIKLTYREYNKLDSCIKVPEKEKDTICYFCPKSIENTDEALELFTGCLRLDFRKLKSIIETKKNLSQNRF